MKLVDNINNVELKTILHDHLLKLLEGFNADLKKLKES